LAWNEFLAKVADEVVTGDILYMNKTILYSADIHEKTIATMIIMLIIMMMMTVKVMMIMETTTTMMVMTVMIDNGDEDKRL
jgi:hypothetical protein